MTNLLSISNRLNLLESTKGIVIIMTTGSILGLLHLYNNISQSYIT